MRSHPITDFQPASFLDRVLAFVIDGFIIGIGQLVVQKMIGEIGSGLSSILTVAYFTAFQVKMGATPGKKMMGLRLLSADSNDFATPKAVFLRETIGRTVSFLTLFLGYFWALFQSEARTFHDMIGGTRLIQEKAKATSVLKALSIGMGVLFVFVGTFLFTVFYTSIPLKSAARNLEMKGDMKIQGITGSLAKGFQVQQLEFDKSEQGKMTLNDIRFEYDLWNLIKDEKLSIDRISVGRGRFDLKPSLIQGRPSQAAAGIAAADKADGTSTVGDKKKPKRSLQAMIVKVVDLNQIEILYGNQTIKMDRFWARDLNFDKTKGASVAQIGIDSPSLKASTGKVEVTPTGDFTMSHSLDVRIGPGLLPTVEKEISLRFFGERVMGQLTNLSLSAFSDKVRMWRKSGLYHLQVKDFSPGDYYKVKSPIRSLSISASSPIPLLTDYRGTMLIGTRSASLNGLEVNLSVGQRKYTGALSPFGLAPMLSSGQLKLPLVTTSEPMANPADELALLMYDRGFEELSAEEKQVVQSQQDITISRPAARNPASIGSDSRAEMVQRMMEEMRKRSNKLNR
ncbi:MAG: RDD family protein [Bdellovibrionales bacterium]